MAKFSFFMCLLFLAVFHIEFSSQRNLRVRRQDFEFPDDTDNRFGGGWQRPDRPSGQNRPVRPDNRPNPNRPNNNNNNNNNQRPTTTTAATTPGETVTTPAPTPDPTCVGRCLFTPEYNPVCGTNRQNYDSPGRLECARQCGIPNLRLLRIGRCPGA